MQALKCSGEQRLEHTSKLGVEHTEQALVTAKPSLGVQISLPCPMTLTSTDQRVAAETA